MLKPKFKKPALTIGSEESKPRKLTRIADAVAPVSRQSAGSSQREPAHSNGGTCLQLYLCEIGKIKRLTPQEEIDLAASIKKGDKKAREQMIKANLRLVVKIARNYEGLGVPLLDLISEGNIGLMRAVERFDPAKGAKLSTYSAWWIKQVIKKALAEQSKTIRLPIHMVDKISKMNRAATRLQEVYGREPTDEEVGEELSIKPSRVAQMRIAAIRPASLDAPIGDEDDGELADVVQDESAETPYEQLEEKAVTGMLREILKALPSREVKVLSARFGLNGWQPRTLEEISGDFGLSRERVRQIQVAALKKLRTMIEKLEKDRKPESSGFPRVPDNLLRDWSHADCDRRAWKSLPRR